MCTLYIQRTKLTEVLQRTEYGNCTIHDNVCIHHDLHEHTQYHINNVKLHTHNLAHTLNLEIMIPMLNITIFFLRF